ncbi:MAG: carboxylating nicotinate-nucleotide diphosphorylase [Desulfobulbaceae bacterium]|nr:carboxylating nicotinate-nucleotide diphosphorylase [Desulfobulbaceae bacterium]
MDNIHLRQAIQRFLREDIGSGDITTEAIFAADQEGEALFVAKESFVAAGLEQVAAQVFLTRNPAIAVSDMVADGTRVVPGTTLLKIHGPVADLLQAERVALNLAQRLCGIATHTSRFVEAVMPLPVRIVDTRKTTPGLRVLEKYAVRVGGGHNHRFNLADGVLIKDNHIAACGSITAAVERVRSRAPHTLKIEVEAENLPQVRECLDCGVEIILLDNMTPSQLKAAVAIAKGRALLEASGGVNLSNVRAIAETGVDLISIGALTHSAPAVDISMRWVVSGSP